MYTIHCKMVITNGFLLTVSFNCIVKVFSSFFLIKKMLRTKLDL